MSRTRRMFVGLVLAAVAAPAAVAGPENEDQRPAIERMNAEDAWRGAREGRLVLVDVRPPEAWKVGGVPEGAHALDLDDPFFYEAIEELTGSDPSMPVAFICYTGGRSRHAAEELARRGYARAIDVPEGLRGSSAGPGWIARGLPMVALAE